MMKAIDKNRYYEGIPIHDSKNCVKANVGLTAND